MKVYKPTNEWPEGDTRPPEIKARDRTTTERIPVPAGFGGARASEIYADAITNFARKYGIDATVRELQKQAREPRTIEKYMLAATLRLKEEENNGHAQP